MAKAEPTTGMDYAAHERTYAMFVRLTIGGIIATALVVVALAAMTVIGGWAFWIGAIGMIVGLIVIAATLGSGLSWIPALLVLAATIVLSALTI